MSRFISLFLFFTFAGSSIASATDLYKTYSWAIQQSVKKETSSPLHVKKVIDSAHSLLGIPYLWGGMSREKGFDCSGMLVYLFKNEANIHIPRTTSAMLNADLQKVARHQLKPGDAVFSVPKGGRGAITSACTSAITVLFMHRARARRFVSTRWTIRTGRKTTPPLAASMAAHKDSTAHRSGRIDGSTE